MGMARADTSADQMQENKASTDVGMRKPMDNLKRTDWIIARNILDLVQEYYTDPRIMSITHNELTGEQKDISINWPNPETGELANDVTMGEYDIVVISQPARSGLDKSQFDQAKELRELGVPIPSSFLVENSNLINKTALVAAIKEQEEGEAAQAKQKLKDLSDQLTVADQKANVSKTEADALLKRAKAGHAIAQTQMEAGGDQTAQAEMDLKEREHQLDVVHDQEKHDQEMQIEREKHQAKLEENRMQALEKAKGERVKAIAMARQAAKQPTTTKETS